MAARSEPLAMVRDGCRRPADDGSLLVLARRASSHVVPQGTPDPGGRLGRAPIVGSWAPEPQGLLV